MIYNLTLSNNSLQFNIQQNEQIFRSYRLIRKYTENISIPSYLEFSTPTTNYTLFINCQNHSIISFNLSKNNQLLANGSGLYDLSKGLSVNLTDINPKHIGKISIDFSENIIINASKFLGGELFIKLNSLSHWNQMNIEIQSSRIFFFFKQNFLFYFSYNIPQTFFNLTFIRNENQQIHCLFQKTQSYFNYVFIMNTSLLELNHHTQVICMILFLRL